MIKLQIAIRLSVTTLFFHFYYFIHIYYLYRIIDFKRDKENIPGKVSTIEYDPNRTAFIALIVYADGEKRYILAPDKLKVGDPILSGSTALPITGHAMFLKDIPLGSTIHAIEMTPGRGAALARSAGTFATLVRLATRI